MRSSPTIIHTRRTRNVISSLSAKTHFTLFSHTELVIEFGNAHAITNNEYKTQTNLAHVLKIGKIVNSVKLLSVQFSVFIWRPIRYFTFLFLFLLALRSCWFRVHSNRSLVELKIAVTFSFYHSQLVHWFHFLPLLFSSFPLFLLGRALSLSRPITLLIEPTKQHKLQMYANVFNLVWYGNECLRSPKGRLCRRNRKVLCSVSIRFIVCSPTSIRTLYFNTNFP